MGMGNTFTHRVRQSRGVKQHSKRGRWVRVNGNDNVRDVSLVLCRRMKQFMTFIRPY